MNLIKPLLLLLLSAIWGFSFIFMRILAPVFGPFITADMRLFIAGLAMAVFFAFTRYETAWRSNIRLLLVIGLINSGIPFLFYSFAAMHIPGSVSSIINATAPLFSAFFSFLILGESLPVRKIFGLIMGIAGVFIISAGGTVDGDLLSILSVTACFGAASCYGLAGIIIKKRASHLKPMALAGITQLAAGTALLPLVLIPHSGDVSRVSPGLIGLLILFALLCSAFAYVIYFYLISHWGPTRALTVTYLIPVFGIAGGHFVLGETVTPVMLSGVAVVLTGTWLVISAGVKRSR